MIYGNVVGSSGRLGKTIIIQDEDGQELVGVVTNEKAVFDATPNDIRLGKIAATTEGVTQGEKVIPSYNTSEGYKLIPSGSTVKITGVKDCEYTKLQALICVFNSSISDSVATEKVCINEGVYPVNSAEQIATVVVEEENSAISLGITNESENPVLVRYFMYRRFIDMSMTYAYNFAEIDPSTNMCVGFISTSNADQGNMPNWVEVPVNDPEYIGKYYINGNWYEDAAGTIPWTSSLL